MTAEPGIMGEGVSNVLLRDGVLRHCVLVVAHQEHASQVTDQVLFGVRVITELLGSHEHSIRSRVWLRRYYGAIIALREKGKAQHTGM